MTKAFLEEIILQPTNEKFVIEAFSQKNLKKIKEFESKKATKLKKIFDRKLSINDITTLK